MSWSTYGKQRAQSTLRKKVDDNDLPPAPAKKARIKLTPEEMKQRGSQQFNGAVPSQPKSKQVTDPFAQTTPTQQPPATMDARRITGMNKVLEYAPFASKQEVRNELEDADTQEFWVGHNTTTRDDAYYIMIKKSGGRYIAFYGGTKKSCTRKDYGAGDRDTYETMKTKKERKGYTTQASWWP